MKRGPLVGKGPPLILHLPRLITIKRSLPGVEAQGLEGDHDLRHPATSRYSGLGIPAPIPIEACFLNTKNI